MSKCEKNIDLKLDLTESVNGVIKNSLDKPTESFGEISGTILSFVHNFFLYPLQRYNIYAKEKLVKYEENLKNRINEIEPDEVVESSVNIIGPTLESLKYNLDEEYIKEMFTNILISDMTKSMKDKVQPCFIEIVKQLSNNDAILIQALKYFNIEDVSVLVIKYTNVLNKSYTIINHVFVISENVFIIPALITLDNLQRLELIKIDYGNHIYGDEEMCKKAFENVKNDYEPKKDFEITYDMAVCEITNLGQAFIEVCTREDDIHF